MTDVDCAAGVPMEGMAQKMEAPAQSPSLLDERKLVARILTGHIDDFQIIVERSHEELARIVGRHIPRGDHSEVLQNAYIRAYNALPTFAFRSPLLHWLSIITVRTCHDYWRRKKREEKNMPRVSFADAAAEEQSAESAEEQRLEAVLRSLSATDRMVLSMMYLEDLSVREISERLGLSQVSVKVRAYRARKRALKVFKEGV